MGEVDIVDRGGGEADNSGEEEYRRLRGRGPEDIDVVGEIGVGVRE